MRKSVLPLHAHRVFLFALLMASTNSPWGSVIQWCVCAVEERNPEGGFRIMPLRVEPCEDCWEDEECDECIILPPVLGVNRPDEVPCNADNTAYGTDDGVSVRSDVLATPNWTTMRQERWFCKCIYVTDTDPPRFEEGETLYCDLCTMDDDCDICDVLFMPRVWISTEAEMMFENELM